MLLVNPDIVEDAFKCKEKTARYLIYECGLPILGLKDNLYYFSNTDELKKCLDKLPLLLKIFKI